jgi:hypothetical protein
MRCMTSVPVPSFQRIGTRPATIAVTVIIFGRTRLGCAFDDRAVEVGAAQCTLLAPAVSLSHGQSLVRVDEHHRAGLRGNPRQRDEAHC